MNLNTRSIDDADETEFRGQVRSQSGDWERGASHSEAPHAKPRSREGMNGLAASQATSVKSPFAPLRLCVSFCLLCVLALLGLADKAWAEDASASATLSSATTTVGEPVLLQVTIQGTQDARRPEVRVDGLTIQYVGPSANSSFQIHFGGGTGNGIQADTRTTHTYTVLPGKEGTFTIPALSINAGGKKLTTQPLTLTVLGSPGGGSQPVDSANAQAAQQKTLCAEWVLPKDKVYVGEAIPMELRLYIDARVEWRPIQIPSVSGDGFILQKMTRPNLSEVTKDGRKVDMAVFKTAITPVKAGKVTLPATDIFIEATVQEQTPFGPMNIRRQVSIPSNSLEVEVLPLPVVGKPKDFSGAVGQFTMEPTKASPSQVRAGDPVTVTVAIKGIGSFDRMGAPAVAEEPGWRVYPPSGKFAADDEVGISGAKTFEIAAIPETQKAELPKITFSFFNPSTERYETLTGDRFPLTVQGVPVSAPTPTTGVAAAAPSVSAPTPTPPPKPNDIQYIRVDSGVWGVGFEPVWNTRNFWLAQLLPFSALLMVGGWQWRRARQNNGTARRAARLRQSKAEVFRVLRQEKTLAHDFYDAAIRAFQIETALGRIHSDLDPGMIDAEAACASRPLDCETEEGIRRVFAAHDQLRYAGIGPGGSSDEPIYPDQRERVLQILAQFEKSHV